MLKLTDKQLNAARKVHEAQVALLIDFDWEYVSYTGPRGLWIHPSKQFGGILPGTRSRMIEAYEATYAQMIGR